MLDPFQPEDPKDVERLKALQARIHELFVRLVRDAPRREAPAGSSRPVHGRVLGRRRKRWNSASSTASAISASVMRERFGEKVQIRMIPPARPSLLARLFGRRSFATESLFDPAEALAAVEERAAWARLGL